MGSINPDFSLIFRNIYGGLNHRLIEPLYQWERQFTDKPESGLQLVYCDKRYSIDIWVNWQRFIEHGDFVPEILTVGTSASAKLSYSQQILQNLFIGAQVETYTDLGRKSTDYSFGLHLRFNGNFTLKHDKK